jgi:hypothetical protein
MVGHGDRYPAGIGDLTSPCQHLSPLCVRSLGGCLAQEICARRGDRPPLCGRQCATKARRGDRDVIADDLKQPCCTRHEGRPLELELQGWGSNHRKRRWSKGRGRERFGKGGTTRQVSAGKTNVSEPLRKCRKHRDVIRTGLQLLVRDRARKVPADWPSGDRHKDGVIPVQGLVRNVGTCGLDAKGEIQVEDPRG